MISPPVVGGTTDYYRAYCLYSVLNYGRLGHLAGVGDGDGISSDCLEGSAKGGATDCDIVGRFVASCREVPGSGRGDEWWKLAFGAMFGTTWVGGVDAAGCGSTVGLDSNHDRFVGDEGGCRETFDSSGDAAARCRTDGADGDGPTRECLEIEETKTDRNRRWRQEKKEKKQRRKARQLGRAVSSKDWNADKNSKTSGEGVVVESSFSVDAAESLRERWTAENRLAKLKADRQYEVLKTSDLEIEKKRYATGVTAGVERNMVSIEKTHATLRASGNVPGVPALDHDVHTVLDGSAVTPCSISPNSSVSEAEVRKMQKDLLDANAKVQKLLAAMKKCGIEENLAMNIDKETFTVNTEGIELFDATDDCHGVFHTVMRDGVEKWKHGEDPYQVC